MTRLRGNRSCTVSVCLYMSAAAVFVLYVFHTTFYG
jgi:hypothetical protein